jgi:hypothetical protein
MNGKINLSGYLMIEREAGEFKYQDCPFTHADCGCGDWCPLFGEPHLAELQHQTLLGICNFRTFCFDNFTDERSKP